MNCPELSSGSSASSIAIIGGGIAGLSAAHCLIDENRNRQVSMFEASGRLGGVLQSIVRDGYLIERSADSFLATDELPHVRDLAGKLGLDREMISLNAQHRRALVVRNGSMIPIPRGFQLMAATRLWPLLVSPALPFSARLRVALEPFVPAKHQSSDESITHFITRRIGKQAFEYLAQPLVAGIYSGDPDLLSAAAAIRQYVDFEQKFGSVARGLAQTGVRRSAASGARYAKFRTFSRGMVTLVDALESSLRRANVNLHLEARVTALRRVEGGWQVTTERGSNHFNRLIIATSAQAASKLLLMVDSDLAKMLGEIQYTDVAVVSLGCERASLPSPLDAFGVVVPRRERRKLIAASFSSVKVINRAPHGHELVRVFIGGALQPHLAQLPRDELAALAQDELRNLLALRSSPRVLDVVNWNDASPQYNLGHLDRVQKIEQRVEKLPGLELAGSGYQGVGLPQCVQSGQLAVSKLLTSNLLNVES